MPGSAGEHRQTDQAGRAASVAGPAVVAPAERGATRIADRVVTKVAAQAAREALGPLSPDAASPQATVVVRSPAPGPPRAGEPPAETANVRVVVELDYPCDIGGRCRAVRRRVAERVGALTGMDVYEVAVRVERLHLAPAHGRTQ
ncbi:Asp23/Gls24 family envelope stress response protein [Streptomyces caeni]|uniref:Asp23/Gls24 family envelope stress response protein n=1 Tax=Streptomyces caeni TaxID=2307231 RepID=A0ABW4IUV3_9ACTN